MTNHTMTQESADHGALVDTAAMKKPWYQQFTPAVLDTVAALAATRLEQGQYRIATEMFAFLAVAQPDHIAYLSGYAYCLQRSDRPADAITILARIVMLDPHMLHATMMIAECRLALGEVGEAIDLLTLLVRYRNEHPAPTVSINDTAARATALLNLLSAAPVKAHQP